jgi:hypothetical protein
LRRYGLQEARVGIHGKDAIRSSRDPRATCTEVTYGKYADALTVDGLQIDYERFGVSAVDLAVDIIERLRDAASALAGC